MTIWQKKTSLGVKTIIVTHQEWVFRMYKIRWFYIYNLVGRYSTLNMNILFIQWAFKIYDNQNISFDISDAFGGLTVSRLTPIRLLSCLFCLDSPILNDLYSDVGLLPISSSVWQYMY